VPDAAVLVVTVRALKAHSGHYKVVPGRSIDPTIFQPNVQAVLAGVPNMHKHLENIAKFNLPCVVAINRFPSDSEDEINTVMTAARQAGAFDVAISEAHTGGGAGAAGCRAVVRAHRPQEQAFQHLTRRSGRSEDDRVHRHQIYGAEGVVYGRLPAGHRDLHATGLRSLPSACQAQYSFSHDPHALGRRRIQVPVRTSAHGRAGFLTPPVGCIQTMPAPRAHPAAWT